MRKLTGSTGKIAIGDIYDYLERTYGFSPCNMSAFVFGFLLKEYSRDPYRSMNAEGHRDSMTPEKLAEYQEAQGAVTSALGKLLAISESYPDLKANQNFLELQAQLEGTENRINEARRKFNNVAKEYNTAIRRFPKSILAGMFGFDKRAYFEAAEGAQNAPVVEF